jgi:hypothetical protein
MVENLEKIIERDGKLDELLVKGENIDNQAKIYKYKAKDANKKMEKRKFCCWFITIATILTVGVGVFLLLWLVFGVIKF